MLTTIGAAIKTRVESLSLFKVVEQGFSKRALSTPPSAVFFLAADRRVQESPYVVRELEWNVALLVSYLDPAKAHPAMDDRLDAVRQLFVGWVPTPAGSKPAVVGDIRFEAAEDTLLIYTVPLTLTVMPEMIV